MSAANELTPLYLLSDEPIGASKHDKLNHDRYARLIAETALGTNGPFTIGVYGGWGQGKTSLLRHAMSLLNARKADAELPDSTSKSARLHPEVVTVFFNAWRYEREPHPIIPLVATIAREVQRRAAENVTATKKVTELISSWWGKIVDAARATIGATKVDWRGSLGDAKVAQVSGGLMLDGGAAQQKYSEFQQAREAADALRTKLWIDESLYLSAFDDLESFWDEKLVRVGTPSAPHPRLVVFIDDLDRCEPRKAFELLEGVKLALSQPGFIFVLALNADIVHRYLALEAERRYGTGHIRLGDRYLDKIVQLEIPLRSHKTEFPSFIERTVTESLADLLTDGKGKLPEELTNVLLSMRESLGRFTRYTPRTLIRRLNSLIADERLLPQSVPFAPIRKDEAPVAYASRRRAHYLGLLLVQRTLVETPDVGADAVRALHEDQSLCDLIARIGFDATFEALKPRDAAGENRASPDAPKRSEPPTDLEMRRLNEKQLRILAPFRGHEDLIELWNSESGKTWLTVERHRRAVVDLVAERATVAAVATPSARVELASSGMVPVEPDPEQLRREVAIIERKIRSSLGLSDGATLTTEQLASVTQLLLSFEPITDAGCAWLSRAETGLKALNTLLLSYTQVTDAGLTQLAREDSGLTALTSLSLNSTRVTKAGLTQLARAKGGLKALTELYVSETQLTDAVVKDLKKARPDLTIIRW